MSIACTNEKGSRPGYLAVPYGGDPVVACATPSHGLLVQPQQHHTADYQDHHHKDGDPD